MRPGLETVLYDCSAWTVLVPVGCCVRIRRRWIYGPHKESMNLTGAERERVGERKRGGELVADVAIWLSAKATCSL